MIEWRRKKALTPADSCGWVAVRGSGATAGSDAATIVGIMRRRNITTGALVVSVTILMTSCSNWSAVNEQT